MKRGFLNVLFVEDELLLHDLFKQVSENEKIDIISAYDGLDGLKQYKKKFEKLDCIISDIEMPRMDGIKMVEKIRQFNKKIPIFFISSKDYAEVKDKLDLLKINKYIQKPTSYKELLNLVFNLQK